MQSILAKFLKRPRFNKRGDPVRGVKVTRCPCRLDGDSVESSWTTANVTAYLGHQSYEAHRYAPGAMHYLILTRDPMDQFVSSFFYKNPADYSNDTETGRRARACLVLSCLVLLSSSISSFVCVGGFGLARYARTRRHGRPCSLYGRDGNQ